jgi:hypothetical protein
MLPLAITNQSRRVLRGMCILCLGMIALGAWVSIGMKSEYDGYWTEVQRLESADMGAIGDWRKGKAQQDALEDQAFANVAGRRRLLAIASAVFFPFLAVALAVTAALHEKPADITWRRVCAVGAPVAMLFSTVRTHSWAFSEWLIMGGWALFLLFCAGLLSDLGDRRQPVVSVNTRRALFAAIGIASFLAFAGYDYFQAPGLRRELPHLDAQQMSAEEITRAYADFNRADDQRRSAEAAVGVPLLLIGLVSSAYGLWGMCRPVSTASSSPTRAAESPQLIGGSAPKNLSRHEEPKRLT